MCLAKHVVLVFIQSVLVPDPHCKLEKVNISDIYSKCWITFSPQRSTSFFGDWLRPCFMPPLASVIGFGDRDGPKVTSKPMGDPKGDISHLFRCRLAAKAGSPPNTLTLTPFPTVFSCYYFIILCCVLCIAAACHFLFRSCLCFGSLSCSN